MIRKCVRQAVKMVTISCSQEPHRAIKRIIINFHHVHWEPLSRCSTQKLVVAKDVSQVNNFEIRAICLEEINEFYFFFSIFTVDRATTSDLWQWCGWSRRRMRLRLAWRLQRCMLLSNVNESKSGWKTLHINAKSILQSIAGTMLYQHMYTEIRW